MEAKFINSSLPKELVSRLLFLNKNSKVSVKLSSFMIVNKGLNGLTNGLFEASVFEKNELLGKLGLTCRNVILRHVIDEKKPEDILEQVNIVVCKAMDKFFELLPCNSLATDVNV
jgi:hypothetical protein